MKKQATKKQIQKVLDGLIGDIQATFQRAVNTETLFGLFLEYKGEGDGFNKFLKEKIEKSEADGKK